MTRIKTPGRSKTLWRSAPIAFVALLGFGAAACGSSGTSHTQNSPTTPVPPAATTPATAPSTTAPQSGGAGF